MFGDAPLRFAPGASLVLPQSCDAMYEQIALLGYFERQLSAHVVAMACQHGGLMLDVGANVGYFSVLWAAAQPSNSVIAIEPSPLVFPWLSRNIERGNFGGRIKPLQQAAAAEPGQMSLWTVRDMPTGWARLSVASAHDDMIQVETVPLDSLVSPGQSVGFLKIDVEGAESMVLRGAKRLLQERQVQAIYLEQNLMGAREMGLDPDEAIQLLRAAGYRLEKMATSPNGGIVEWWGQLG